MAASPPTTLSKSVVAFGPELPEFGSWHWIGADMAAELAERFETVTFRDQVPHSHAVVYVKFAPSAEVLTELRGRGCRVVYCPVDYYGRAADIDADHAVLFQCNRIVVHSERLRKYFSTYAHVECLDHHVKFAAPVREEFRPEGPLIWIGVRSNLPALAQWVNRHPLPGELWVLTNPENPNEPMIPADYGFEPENRVRMEAWSQRRHREWTRRARAALDVKGDDFRQRHKPAAKAVDFIASGVPLAMNRDSSSAEYLAQRGFSVASPDEPERWLSRDYWEETVKFARKFRDELSLKQVAAQFERIINSVLAETDGR